MKVNPKGICCNMPIPNVMILVQAVNEFQTKHPEYINLIDRRFVSEVREKGKFFIFRRLRTLYLNYEEFEKQAESLLTLLKNDMILDETTSLEIEDKR